MTDDLVGGSFDPVGVVASAFDHALAGTVASLGKPMTQDLGDGLGCGLVKVFRGEWPPGR
jgi:hypothetical protein